MSINKAIKNFTKKNNRGLFITIEGGDGSGKSTQIKLLSKSLYQTPHLTTFEPGSTEFGVILRNLIQHDKVNLNSKTEALLFAADRSYHVDNVIRPALQRGETVITDRYIDSSLAYQGGGREIPINEIEKLSLWATNNLIPDITIFLDISEENSLARIKESKDKIENAGVEFHKNVLKTYKKLSEQYDERFIIVDAEQSIEKVHQEIIVKVAKKLKIINSKHHRS